MGRFLIIFLILFSVNSCTTYTPLYENVTEYKYFLQNLFIKTDDNKISKNIKNELLRNLPSIRDIKYILFLETNVSTSSTVNNIDGKISGYELETVVKAKLYKRLRFDKLIYSFEEKANSPYYLTSEEVLSTLASRNNAIELNTKNLSKKIYNSLIIFISQEN